MTTLKQIQQNQLQKEVVINDNFSSVSPAGIFAFKGNTNGLNYNYYGGIYVDSFGKPVDIADGSVVLGNNAKNYVCFNPTTNKVEVSQLALADGVVPMAEVTVANSVITAIKDTRMHKYIALGDNGGGGSSYTLPIASDKTLGGIKVGKNLTINPDGTLDAQPGGGGGLTYLTEKYKNTIPFSTTDTCVSLVADNLTEASVSIAISPKGFGSFSLNTPDSGVAGGNKRGNYAIDLQMKRSSAGYVANGNYSAILWGNNNLASGANSMSGGENNQATGIYSIAIGYGNTSGGNTSFVGGSSNKVIGDNSAAFGSGNTVSGSNSFTIGVSNQSNSNYTFISGTNNKTGGQYSSIISGGNNVIDNNGNYAVIVGGNYASNKGSMGGYYFGPVVKSGQGSNQQSKYILNRLIDIPGTYPEWNLNFDNSTSSASNQIPVTAYETKYIKGNILVTDYNTTAANIDGSVASFDVEFCVQQMGSKATTQLIGTPKITKAFSNTNGDSRGWDIRIDCDTTNGVVQVILKNPNFKNFKICAVLDSIDIIMNNN